MSNAASKTPRRAGVDIRDALFVLGLALTGYGAWQVFAPAGFLVPGLIICAVSIFGVRR